MASAVCGQAPENLLAHEREVSEEVENLVTHEFIRIPQRRLVEHALVGEHDRVFKRSATDQARCLESFDFMVETERPGRRDERAVVFRREFDLELLMTAQGMLESELGLQARAFYDDAEDLQHQPLAVDDAAVRLLRGSQPRRERRLGLHFAQRGQRSAGEGTLLADAAGALSHRT